MFARFVITSDPQTLEELAAFRGGSKGTYAFVAGESDDGKLTFRRTGDAEEEASDGAAAAAAPAAAAPSSGSRKKRKRARA